VTPWTDWSTSCSTASSHGLAEEYLRVPTASDRRGPL
jgi:hypothetical protein